MLLYRSDNDETFFFFVWVTGGVRGVKPHTLPFPRWQGVRCIKAAPIAAARLKVGCVTERTTVRVKMIIGSAGDNDRGEGGGVVYRKNERKKKMGKKGEKKFGQRSNIINAQVGTVQTEYRYHVYYLPVRFGYHTKTRIYFLILPIIIIII